MTDPDERTINYAIALLGDEYQDEREEARAALHRLFRDRRRLEDEVERLREQLGVKDLSLNEAVDEVERLRAERDEARSIADEGWEWLDRALEAAGWETVFDIPGWQARAALTQEEVHGPGRRAEYGPFQPAAQQEA